jgi:hypothetical protein
MRQRLAARLEHFPEEENANWHGRSGAQAIRRRVRLYYWKQWKQPRTRRRNLIALGIDPAEVHRASRSRKGYWRMSQMSLVRQALNNRWLEEQGVPDMRAVWIKLHYGPRARV